MQVRVAYSYDPESRNWCCRAPSLGIIGGANTREEARRAVLDTVALTLEDEPDTSNAVEAEIEYLELAINRRLPPRRTGLRPPTATSCP